MPKTLLHLLKSEQNQYALKADLQAVVALTHAEDGLDVLLPFVSWELSSVWHG